MIKLFYVFMLASIVMEIPHGTESMGSGIKEESVGIGTGINKQLEAQRRQWWVCQWSSKFFKMRGIGPSINRELSCVPRSSRNERE